MTRRGRVATAAALAVALAVAAASWQLATLDLPDAPALRRAVQETTAWRLAGALTIGAALGLAGVLLRTATDNPLADPEVTGVNHGAAFGAVTVSWLFGAGASLIPGALVGGAIAAAIVMLVGTRGQGRRVHHRLILVGVAVSALFGSWTSVILVFNEARLEVVLSWLAGSLAGIGPAHVLPVLLVALALSGLSILLHRRLDLLGAGDETARGVGLRVERARAWALVAVVALVATAVAAAGPIGFVGLLAAALTRATVGAAHRRTIPLALLLGACLLVVADVIGQHLFAPQETPIGVLTALVGAPLLLWRVRREVRA